MTALPAGGPILGLETASDDAEVVVMQGDEVLATESWRVAETISKELLAAIDRALRAASVERSELAAIAIDAGPGGYTALRAGVATAQGLALALGVPLAGVNRLEVAAFQTLQAHPGRPVVAVHDAGRERIAWAAYTSDGAATEAPPGVLIEPRSGALSECVASAREPVAADAIWSGELSQALVEARRAAGLDAEDAPPEAGRLQASNVVRLARLHEAFGRPETVDVVYLRPPSITRPRGEVARP